MRKNHLFIFLLLLTACAPDSFATVVPTVRLLSPPTSTEAVTLPPTKTLTPVPTLTTTLVPVWTPLPTLLPETGLKTFYGWLEGGDSCHLPCWAGITPGETSWAEAKQMIESMSGFAKLDVFRGEKCTFGECNEIRWSLNDPIIGVGYLYSKLPENKIHLIQIEIVDPDLLKALSLKNILNQYGKPAMLLFSTEPDQPGQKFLELILIYPEKQFVIKYSKFAQLSGDDIVSCGKDSNIALIMLDNKEQLMSLNSIAIAVETKNLYVDVGHKPVEDAAGMTIDTFFETFSKANAPCIKTPIKAWMP